MIRVLLIGCGEIAMAAHVPALRALQDEGAVEATVCDVDGAKARAAASQVGGRWTTDWRAAATDVEAAVVCVPPGPNAEIAAAALDLGLHVLCEKPPGRSVADAEAMAAAAGRRPDLVSMIAFNRRFTPLYRRAIARSVELGPPTAFYGRFTRDALGAAPSNTVADWITSDSSHALDLAVATIGLPRAVAVARSSVGAGPDNVWTVQLHADRASALLFFHYAAGRRRERFEWAGPGYDVSLELPVRGDWAQAGSPVETWKSDEFPGGSRYPFATGVVDEHRAFLSAVRGDASRPDCDFAYGAWFMGLVETVRSATGGTLREVAPFVAPSREGTRDPDEAVAGEGLPARAGPRPSRPHVLIHHPLRTHWRFFDPDRLAALRRAGDVYVWSDGDDDTRALEEAHVVVTGRGAPPLPGDFAGRAAKLELLVVLGASVRNYHAGALLEGGVTVCNTADAVAQSVAEHCLLLALAGLRQLPQLDRAMHGGGWPRPAAPASRRPGLRQAVKRLPLPPAVAAGLRRVDKRTGRLTHRPVAASASSGPPRPSDLQGQVVGLAGWGHTSRRFARLLAPFGCDLLVMSDAADPDDLAEVGARRASLGEVLGSKVVSLHRGLTDETRGFLGPRELAQIAPGAVLVNTARSELVDEAALLQRVRRGDIVAGLDVFDEEPLPRNHPLRKLENVILSPHVASATAQEERRMGEEALAKVLSWLDGGTVDGIDLSRLARMT
jgi:phosphoglycerate dehydrogenase-like enzyme/predicted dehydrogenase